MLSKALLQIFCKIIFNFKTGCQDEGVDSNEENEHENDSDDDGGENMIMIVVMMMVRT